MMHFFDGFFLFSLYNPKLLCSFAALKEIGLTRQEEMYLDVSLFQAHP